MFTTSDDTGHGCTDIPLYTPQVQVHTHTTFDCLVEPRVPGRGSSSSGTTAVTTAIGWGTAVRWSSTTAASVSTTVRWPAAVVWATVSESTATTSGATAKRSALEGARRPATTIVSVSTTASTSAGQLVQGRVHFLLRNRYVTLANDDIHVIRNSRDVSWELILTWLASVSTAIRSLACFPLFFVKSAYEVPVAPDRPVRPIRWM